MNKIDRDFESLKLLKDWSVWMIGVEIAILGFLGIMKRTDPNVEPRLFEFTVVAFSISILCAAWVLSGIPSVTRRLDKHFDYSKTKLYAHKWIPSFFTLDRLAICQHIFFAAGIVLFGILIVKS